MAAIRKPLPALGRTVGELFSRRVRSPSEKDSWGLEIEFEGPSGGRRRNVFDSLAVNLPEHLNELWNVVSDGSLRNGAEVVSNGPTPFSKLPEALDVLDAAFKKVKFEPTYSYRTSVHVHMNVCHLNMVQLANVFILHTLLEDSLMAMAGEERRGNLHCLLFTECSAQVENIRRTFAVQTDTDFQAYFNSWFTGARYGALNVQSLQRFGTLEFRLHNGTHDKSRLLAWVTALRNIRQLAENTQDPRDILQMSERTVLSLIPDQTYWRPITTKVLRTAAEIGHSRLNWAVEERKARKSSEDSAKFWFDEAGFRDGVVRTETERVLRATPHPDFVTLRQWGAPQRVR